MHTLQSTTSSVSVIVHGAGINKNTAIVVKLKVSKFWSPIIVYWSILRHALTIAIRCSMLLYTVSSFSSSSK